MEISHTNPSAAEILNNKELEEIINQFGSLLSIIVNKHISCVTFFLFLLKNPELQSILVKVSDASWFEIVTYMAYRYPVLNKSKKIK